MIEMLLMVLEERRERFRGLNDRIWGEGGWVECAACPDSFGFPSFHSGKSHGEE